MHCTHFFTKRFPLLSSIFQSHAPRQTRLSSIAGIIHTSFPLPAQPGCYHPLLSSLYPCPLHAAQPGFYYSLVSSLYPCPFQPSQVFIIPWYHPYIPAPSSPVRFYLPLLTSILSCPLQHSQVVILYCCHPYPSAPYSAARLLSSTVIIHTPLPYHHPLLLCMHTLHSLLLLLYIGCYCTHNYYKAGCFLF